MKPQTKELCLCFHKGDPERRFMSNLVKFWTRGEFSHVELYFPGSELSFSASGYENLVRFKSIQYSHPERWAYVEVPESCYDSRKEVFGRCCCLCGHKYDYLGAFGLRFNSFFQNKEKEFCSEADAIGLGWKPTRVSPWKLFRMAISNGCKLIKE